MKQSNRNRDGRRPDSRPALKSNFVVCGGRMLLIATMLIATWALPASANRNAVLYAAAQKSSSGQGSGPTSLFIVDPGTGGLTLVGLIEDPTTGFAFDDVTGLAFLRNGRLVAIASGDDLFAGNSAILISIDPANGAAELIGEIDNDETGNCGRMQDLSYDPTTDTLYAYSDDCVLPDSEGLVIIDPVTGIGTAVGATGFTSGGTGLAREHESGVLFASPSDDQSLITIDTSTGLGTTIPSSVGAVPEDVTSLDFHPISGELYGSYVDDLSQSDDAYLVTIDRSSGAVTVLGQFMNDQERTIDDVRAIAFEAPAGCAPAPINECRTTMSPGDSKLRLKASKSKLRWKWGHGESTELSDLGNPVDDTDYRMCLYDASGNSPVLEMGAAIPAGTNWKEKGSGFRYKDKSGLPDGIRSVKLKANVDGNSAIQVKGKDMSFPQLPLAQSDRIVLQLSNTLGECWDADFADSAAKNDSESFKDRND